MEYEITAPDGRKFVVTAPEGATQDQILAYAKANYASSGEKDYRTLNKPEPVDPTADMSHGERFLAGSGKAFYDIGQGAAQLFGLGESGEETRNRREADKPLMRTAAGLGGNVLSNITALAPLAVVPGANTVGGAAALAGLAGATQAATGAKERMGNILSGAALGSAVQAAPQLPRLYEGARDATRAFFEPLSESGQNQIIGRMLRRATGGDEQAVIQRLQQARELVPGSLPTSGQAANNPGIAAIERTAVATNPTVMRMHGDQLANQNTARVELLRKLSGEGGQRAAMESIRDEGAKEMYAAARALGLDQALMTPARRGEVTKLLNTPAIREAVKEARVLASNEMKNVGNPAGSVVGLDYVKRALDDQIAKATGNEQRVLVGLKDRLLTTVDKLSPAYAQARESFAEMSRPINEMKTVGEVLKKSLRPLDEQLLPGQYARALRDETAREATGFKGATLANTVEPEKLAMLRSVADDLERANFAQTAGRGVGSDTVQKMAMANLMESVGAQKMPTLLNRKTMLANWILDRVYGKADKEMSQKLAESLLAPQRTADLMSGVKPAPGPVLDEQGRARLAQMLRMGAMPAIPYMAGRE